MKKTRLISLAIRLAIMIGAFVYLDVDFTQVKEFVSDDSNQIFLVIGGLLLVLSFLKKWKFTAAK